MANRRPPALTVVLTTLSVFLVLTVANAVAEPDIRGRVVGTSDVDTLTLLIKQRVQYRIRLADIDTPKRWQPYGDQARQVLSDLAFGKTVLIIVRNHDRSGRIIDRVFVEGRDVSAQLVRQGAAWVYRRFSNDPRLLLLKS